MTSPSLHVRWLGRTRYDEADALQHALAFRSDESWLLCQEHEPTYTLGRRANPSNVLVDVEAAGATLVEADRGGDVTYHGPGQLTVYPILSLPGRGAGDRPDTRAHVRTLEQVVIDTLADVGVPGAARMDPYPGVWLGVGTDRARKIAAVGVRLARNRSLHGVALNVDVDPESFARIVPCGIDRYGVTSVAAEGADTSMEAVLEAFVARAVDAWAPRDADGNPVFDRTDVVHRVDPADLAPFSRSAVDDHAADAGPIRAGTPVALTPRRRRRLDEAGVHGGIDHRARKPEWMRAAVRHEAEVGRLKRRLAGAGLVTVCEEAGCPNLSECWSEGTATFMINGERCTRACGFCLVDTRRPEAPDPTEPDRVAAAVADLGLDFAVVTTVARDDLDDGGASGFVATIEAIRRRSPGTRVEVLISDCRGDVDALRAIFDARPDVLNHNVETVPRLQRVARPSAGYTRSMAVLARSVEAGLVTKSGMVLGMGETEDEVASTLTDLAGVGIDIVTLGQYLRPTAAHLPVVRWWTPDDFDRFAEIARSVGISQVESSPFTRSSHHASRSFDAVAGVRSSERRIPEPVGRSDSR